MKINEFKSPKPEINEGFLDALIGDYGAAGLQSMFKPGMTTKAQLAKNIFIKDFVGDALASLTTGLQTGVINPNTGTTPTTNPGGDSPAEPGAGAAPGAAPGAAATPAGAPKAAPAGQNAAATDPYENIKGQMRQLQPQAGAKALPAKMAAELNNDMAKLAKGDKESGIFAANKILKFAAAGYDVSKLAPTWNASSKAGERFLTQSVYRAITNMLREHGLTWDNLGLRVRLYESAGNSGVFLSRCMPIPVATEEYRKLDQVFESIVNVNEFLGFGKKQPAPANPNAMGVADFLNAWLDKYMGPTEWHDKKAQIEPLVQAVAANPNSPRKALIALANAMFAIASVSKVTPPGIANALPQQTPPTAAPAAGQPAQPGAGRFATQPLAGFPKRS
jgi:hypothetical protein